MSERKNEAYRDFEKLTKQLLSVPKKELDRKVDQYNARKAQRKKKQQDK